MGGEPNRKTGFSGLKELASEIDIEVPTQPDSGAPPTLSSQKSHPQISPHPEQTSAQVEQDKQKRANYKSRIWIIGIVVIVLALIIIPQLDKKKKGSSYDSPNYTQTYSPSFQSSSAQSESFPSRRELKEKIEHGKSEVMSLEIQINQLDSQLASLKSTLESHKISGLVDEYNALVPQFNSLVSQRNTLYQEYSLLIEQVNANVRLYNRK